MNAPTPVDDRPVDPDDELLVGYLDGELAREERSQLEERLLTDGGLRSRLQQLQAGWDMLGEIETPTTSPRLVETTIELAVADITGGRERFSSLSRHRWTLLTILLCAVAAGGAAWLTSVGHSRKFAADLEDLGIAEDLDAYNYGSDLALMRELADNPAWVQVVQAGQGIDAIDSQQADGQPVDDGRPNDRVTNNEATNNEATKNDVTNNNATNDDVTNDSPPTIASVPVDQREDMIRELPLSRRLELNSRWDRFSQPTRENEDLRQRVRATAREVATQPDAEKLLQTMRAYAVWRESQPSEVRDEIESDDPVRRRQAIAEAIEATQVSIAERSRSMLDEESIDVIHLALRWIVQKRIDGRDKKTLETYETIKQSANRRNALNRVIVSMLDERRQDDDAIRPDPLTARELEIIEWSLPKSAVETLEVICGGLPIDQSLQLESLTLQFWAAESARRKAMPSHKSARQLYQELPATEREVLDLLPPAEIHRRLRAE